MIEGNIVRLIPLTEADLTASMQWVNAPEIRKGMLRVLPVTPMDQANWYRRIITDDTKNVFAIRLMENDQHVGNVGLYQIDWIHRRAEFWILLGDRTNWGHGLGYEAARLMVSYAFDGLNLQKLYLNVGVDNHRAIALYEKLNFHEEGRFKKHFFIEGRYMDILRMATFRNGTKGTTA